MNLRYPEYAVTILRPGTRRLTGRVVGIRTEADAISQAQEAVRGGREAWAVLICPDGAHLPLWAAAPADGPALTAASEALDALAARNAARRP